MATTLDLMEYASDALAQAAYVTDAGYGSDLCSGGTPVAESVLASQTADLGFDGDSATFWSSGSKTSAVTTWLCYILATAVPIGKVRLQSRNTVAQLGFRGFTIKGSNNTTDGSDGDWTTLATGQNMSGSTSTWTEHVLSYESSWKAIKIEGVAQYYSGDGKYYCQVAEMECVKHDLQAFSESSIKTQGSYSLKGVATTSALNKTLTRTIGSPIDLTGVDILKFDIRSTRTGSNIKIGIHDSGGTTTEVTPNITDANTWQLVVWDISAVANADKDAIDSIIVTIANADSANTFYIDNFLSAEDVTVTAEPIIVTTAMSSSGAVIFLGYGYVYEESSSGEAMDVSARTKASVGNTLLKRKNLKYIYHMMNTHGKDVTMTIYIDGTAHSHTFTINTTTRKMRRIEDVPNMEGHKFDVKLSCDDVTDTDLEIYAPIALHHTTYGE